MRSSACAAIGLAVAVGLCSGAGIRGTPYGVTTNPAAPAKATRKAKPVNLLQNGGFEKVSFEQTRKWLKAHGNHWLVHRRQAMPLGWLLNNGAPGELTIDKADPHKGKRGANLYAGTREAHIYQLVPAQPGQKFQVALWARGRGWLHVRLYYYGKKGKYLDRTHHVNDPLRIFLKPKWTHYQAELTMPDDEKGLVAVGLGLAAMPSSEATIDEVILSVPSTGKAKARTTQPRAK